MYFNISAHKPLDGISSISLVDYLDKENKSPNSDGLYLNESFFDSDIDSKFSCSDVTLSIDNNRGTQNLKSSNFYMLNFSPSRSELRHMEEITENILKERNILKENNPPSSTIYYNEIKDKLMKYQMKLYVKDVMNEYATNFNREICIDESKVPNNEEDKKLMQEADEQFKIFLGSKNIIVEENNKTKIENDKFLTYNNCKILSEKEKDYSVEISINNKKGTANIPKSLVHLQKDQSLKILESVYNEKLKEVNNKNIQKEIDFNFKGIDSVIINKEIVKVYNFEKNDTRFSEPIRFSVQSKDLKINKGNYFVSQHLYNEKVNYATKKGIEKEFNIEKEKIYNDLAKAKGFNLEKRPITEKDLLWYGKVEKNRKYKYADVSVKYNKDISSKISKLEKSPFLNRSKIAKLKESLILDQETKEVVREGNFKGGPQYHCHVVVSRHDKTMSNPRNKISLSPVANQRETTLNNGAKVGFDRNNFANKIEKVFDDKFDYNRDEKDTFQFINNQKKQRISNSIISGDKALNLGKSKIKNVILKHTGLSQIQQNINPILKIKSELSKANIPTQLPTSIVDLAMKGVKKVLSHGMEY